MKLQLTSCALAMLVAGVASADVNFVVNTETGEITIVNDSAETPIAGYSLEVVNGAAGSFDAGVFGNGPVTSGGGSATDSKITELGVFGDFALPAGQTSLGTGLFLSSGPVASSDFLAQVTLGSGSDIDSTVTIIPEPGSLALLGLGGLALLRRRR